MCGIVGEISYRANNMSPDWIAKACHSMAHRGPDGDGFYSDEKALLGHRRLAIIDLAGGAQPMSYADDRFWITFNGEIYNFRALRARLQAEGYGFRTQSDTEVILAGYAAWGEEVVARLNGIFAFGLWDAHKEKLLLARDHLGVKPLLYHYDEEGLRFSSELKGLLLHPRIERQISAEGLQDYLALGYVMSPRTIIDRIHKLPAGHYLTANGGAIQLCSYWQLESYLGNYRSEQNTDELVTTFAALLESSVEEQMVSDVPLGAFLSGGIDSSSISAYAQRLTPHRFKTFSAGFAEASYSELSYAQLAAAHLDTDHHQQVMAPLSLDALRNLIWYYDEPLGDTSIIPTYLVSRLAREHVTVVLSGDGGDELLAGYDTYLADRLQRYYRRLPVWAHQGVIEPLVRAIPSSYRKVSWDFRIKQFVEKAYAQPERAHYGWREMFSETQRLGITDTNGLSYDPFSAYARHFEPVTHADPLDRSLYVDMKTWLTDDILVKVDRASMACHLEARVPFLNPRVVEFGFSLPVRMKIAGWRQKHILKEAMRSRLPAEIINRQKRGFNAPLSLWMRDSMRDEVAELFATFHSSVIDMRSPIVRQLWAEHLQNERDHGFKLWTLLSFLLWEQRVLSA